MSYHMIKFKIPEEQEALDITLSASEMHCFIAAFETWLRDRVKHGEPDNYLKLTSSQWAKLQETYYDIKSEYDL